MGIIFLLLAGGLASLSAGADILVRGATQLAALARITPLVIGLTVVAFGTSAPELSVSIFSAFRGNSEIALGNVVGSNIFNVLFILGISAAIVPLTVRAHLLQIDVPLMIAVSVLVWLLGWDGHIGSWDGLLLVALLFSYTYWTIRASRRETLAIHVEFAQEYGASAIGVARGGGKGVAMALFLSALGLFLLVLGSKWFVDGATRIALLFGVSDLVIGLTIVAAGTSLPEVFTSVVAAIKGERDIAVGNVIGSNLFNLLCVLGFSGLASGVAGFGGVEVPVSAVRFDLIVMIAVAVACLPIFFTGHVISRWEGLLLVAYQVIYAAWLILAEQASPDLANLRFAVVVFALPLTILILMGDTVRSARRDRLPKQRS